MATRSTQLQTYDDKLGQVTGHVETVNIVSRPSGRWTMGFQLANVTRTVFQLLVDLERILAGRVSWWQDGDALQARLELKAGSGPVVCKVYLPRHRATILEMVLDPPYTSIRNIELQRPDGDPTTVELLYERRGCKAYFRLAKPDYVPERDAIRDWLGAQKHHELSLR